MPNIKLFVCCHQNMALPKHELLIPVQVGAALSKKRFEGFLKDDEGENISYKNRRYCELTAQYWAWKNVDADYYGFFHYRRFLSPTIKSKRPYGLTQFLRPDKLGYDSFPELIMQYDLIAPMKEDMHISVREQYCNAPHHYAKDLALVEQILLERFPEMGNASHQYFGESFCFFGNIYIMSKAVFQEYCAWLFPILEEFDRKANFAGYSPQELRVDGYLAERLFGVFYTYRKDSLRVLELPRVHVESDFGVLLRKSVINWLLPPGSKRRALVKGLQK